MFSIDPNPWLLGTDVGARRVARARMIKLRPLSPSQLKFAAEFVRLAGNAAAAARAAGYSPTGAKVRAHHLLRSDATLAAILALPGGAEALSHSRSKAVRLRASLLMATAAPVVQGHGRQFVAIDGDASGMRDHVVRHARHFSAGCQFPVPIQTDCKEHSGLTGGVTGSAIRSTPESEVSHAP